MLYTIAEIATPVLVVLVVLVFTNVSGNFYFPPLQEVAVAFQQNWLFSRVPTDLLPSLFRLLSGYFLAVICGVGFGILLGLNRKIRRQAAPVVEFLRAIPPPALLPFTLIVLGIDNPGKILLIAFVCVWPILLSTMDGIVGMEPTMRDTGRSYRIARVDALISVELPAASPQIFAGMRTSLPLAIIMMVISEMVGASDGIGYFIVQAQRTFALADMWSGIILLGLLGYTLNLIFSVVERRVLAWHRNARVVVQ
ncbi:MAG TPA: ABC transporter permease [Microbacterium sp.]|uniref:ABC transporter permease n=1 Tax=Microbacterium sp. TaxID=51671 RepID=UPI002BCC348E|nr:ABC transporter permease [Microbacterium sp.]HWI31372.1 ABC transporter permease [Microbacterium sp.]